MEVSGQLDASLPSRGTYWMGGGACCGVDLDYAHKTKILLQPESNPDF
jgi:hypothetical protein